MHCLTISSVFSTFLWCLLLSKVKYLVKNYSYFQVLYSLSKEISLSFTFVLSIFLFINDSHSYFDKIWVDCLLMLQIRSIKFFISMQFKCESKSFPWDAIKGSHRQRRKWDYERKSEQYRESLRESLESHEQARSSCNANS